MRRLLLVLMCITSTGLASPASAEARSAGSPRTSHAMQNPREVADVQAVYDGKVMPDLQTSTFRNIDLLFPSRTIARGDTVRPIPRREDQLDIGSVRIPANGRTYDLYDYVSRNRITGLLVASDGEIVLEHYGSGNTPATRWMSMSMAKSLSSTLVGAAIRDGYIRSLDDTLVDYLDALQGSSYGDVTVRQLLQMTSGVQWNENYTDPASDRRRVLHLQIAQEHGAILRYMAGLPRVAEPGDVWNYSTGETHLVGELLRAATGRSLSDYLSEKLWAPLGMESDATWWLEAPDGLEIAGSGFSATLRDYARFGLFMMGGGKVDGVSVLPDGWLPAATAPGDVAGKPVNYGFLWWPVADRDGTFTDGAFSARGIFGQYIYINPTARLVIVVWSARSKPLGAEVIPDNDFFNAMVDVLAAAAVRE